MLIAVKSDEIMQSHGSPAFQSPQIATGEKHFSGFKLDIWAAGVTLYLLVVGQYPFQGDTVFTLYESIAKAQFEIPSWVEKDLADLIRGMLQKDENTRFSIQQVPLPTLFSYTSTDRLKPTNGSIQLNMKTGHNRISLTGGAHSLCYHLLLKLLTAWEGGTLITACHFR